MVAYKQTLRSLAMNDEAFVDSVLGMGHDTVDASPLDPRTHSLVWLAAARAVDAAPSSYRATIDATLAAAPRSTRWSAAPELALALGYDVDEAFESSDPDD